MEYVLCVKIVGVIIDFADINYNKVFDKIFPKDKENTIIPYIINIISHLKLDFWRYSGPKLFILVADTTCPP